MSDLPAIIALGCATPRAMATQDQALRFALATTGLSGDAARFAETVYRRSGIARRASALLDCTRSDELPLDQAFFEPRTDVLDRGPTTGARMLAYSKLAPALACAAAERALANVGNLFGERPGAAVTHLVTVSCTGFSNPGVDLALVEALGLSRGVERLNIGFMGCHGGVVGLRTAASLAQSWTGAAPAVVLLVCVELCSLHLQYGERLDQIVANSLFGDGAAAAVIVGGDGPGRVSGALALRSAATTAFPDSAGAMSWTIGDSGFEMTLAESVPELIRTQLRRWMEEWLGRSGVSMDEVRARGRWAVHPGGPKILRAVGEALELPGRSLECSRDVLSEYGNMSSPTVLFVLERLLESGAPPDAPADAPPDGPVVMLAFGPGLTAEAALLEPGPV